jgi:hypothetical protein
MASTTEIIQNFYLLEVKNIKRINAIWRNIWAQIGPEQYKATG